MPSNWEVARSDGGGLIEYNIKNHRVAKSPRQNFVLPPLKRGILVQFSFSLISNCEGIPDRARNDGVSWRAVYFLLSTYYPSQRIRLLPCS